MSHLRKELAARFAAEIDRCCVEHRGDPIDIILESEEVGGQVRKTIRFELFRSILRQIPVTQVPHTNGHSNIDFLAWGRMMIKSGQFDREIEHSLRHGNPTVISK